MATNSGTKKRNSASKNTAANNKRSTASVGRKTTASSRKTGNTLRQRTEQERMISNELTLLILLAVAILLFLCNFGIIGPVGNAVSGFLFGVFGLLAYIAPICIFIAAGFCISNQGNIAATIKIIAAIILFFIVGAFLHIIQADMGQSLGYSISEIYQLGKEYKKGGGVLFGSFAYLLYSLLDTIGSVLILLVLTIGCIVIITEKSFLNSVKKGGRYVVSTAKDDAVYRREKAAKKREEIRQKREQERELLLEQKEQKLLEEQEEVSKQEAEKILRMEKKVSGVMMDTKLTKHKPEVSVRHDNIHEITIEDLEEPVEVQEKISAPVSKEPEFDFHNIRIHGAHQIELEEAPSFQKAEEPKVQQGMRELTFSYDETPADAYVEEENSVNDMEEPVSSDFIEEEAVQERFEEFTVAPAVKVKRPVAKPAELSEKEKIMKAAGQDIKAMKEAEKKPPKPYMFPPISYLKKSDPSKNGKGMEQLKETAMRLQQTLSTFGVKVTITDISQGPAVTRYELQPEQGVKVSKIVGLADDIKLNLAATDIRMEAPIPGKAAIGIEVPNKENASVGLRDLLESKEYKDFPSKLAFAVGKDIAGKVVVTDIAKMPHMLIAGSTGSGKSVCINTLIMSLLYKATPDEVKLIMIDPKVVELSVYNGIPHLLIPVVTDPKKAAAALHWGVAEMTDRYQKFADFGVRNLKEYNAKLEQKIAAGDVEAGKKMPQIVIIVDELADLMMVSPGEVEESICRLAQLARAAGIHLIIATQRPSVDVITGLIKANMPSRVAFAVSSGVDSRTILDMNGAEKLLGKGDMLFYPQGYPKPVRVQGAFVSDDEVGNIVDFLKNQNIGNVYNEDIEDKIKNIGTSGGGSSSGGGNEKDSYFVEAGKFIIEKEKASIGMLQRVFKIGFNRAARIMDQLAEAGVVGEEEGTKPRKVLMSLEQFEQYIEDYL